MAKITCFLLSQRHPLHSSSFLVRGAAASVSNVRGDFSRLSGLFSEAHPPLKAYPPIRHTTFSFARDILAVSIVAIRQLHCQV